MLEAKPLYFCCSHKTTHSYWGYRQYSSRTPKNEGLLDATEIIQFVKDYDIYLQYWRKVTNYNDYVTHPNWEAQTYGLVGDLYTDPIEHPC